MWKWKLMESTDMPCLRAWFCNTAVKNPATDGHWFQPGRELHFDNSPYRAFKNDSLEISVRWSTSSPGDNVLSRVNVLYWSQQLALGSTSCPGVIAQSGGRLPVQESHPVCPVHRSMASLGVNAQSTGQYPIWSQYPIRGQCPGHRSMPSS